MDIITGIKASGPIPIPSVTLQEASQLFTQLYNQKVDKVKTLDGYEAKNFYIKTLPNEAGPKSEEYVLKILPFSVPNMKEVTEVNIAGMLYLQDCGIVCSAPVQTKEGEYLTMQKLNCCYGNQSSHGNGDDIGTKESNFIVHALTFVSGTLLHNACPKSVPAEWYRLLGEYLARVDKAMLTYPHAEHIPTMTDYGEKSEWSLNSVPRYRKLLHVVEDVKKRGLLECIIDEFEEKVVPKMAQLRKAMLYGDFNDSNIIVKATKPSSTNDITKNAFAADSESKLNIIGIIDFNDMCYSCLLFEIGIGLAYMVKIQREGDRIEVGRHFLQGYNSILPLTDQEWDLLPVCVAGRCVQSILAGLYSHSREPTNEYLLLDVDAAWNVVELVSSMTTQDIVARWRAGSVV